MTAGQMPKTILSDGTADISQFCEFGWYDWVMFRDTVPQYPDDKMILGRWLGLAIDIGSTLTMKILKRNGHVVHQSTVCHLTDDKLHSDVHKEQRRGFDLAITESLGKAATSDDFPPDGLTPEYESYYDDDINVGSADTDPDDTVTPDTGDHFINANVQIARGGVLHNACVVRRQRDHLGNPTGRANANPILDTRSYIVQFEDGDETELTANTIADAIYAQCDPDGNQYLLLEALIDHRCNDNAVKLADQMTIHENGKQYQRRSTAGWQICCQWRDGSTSWQNLCQLKESHPVETAEYAKNRGIDHEPAFNWWVHHVLK
jgi:hypothetical protein